MSDIVENLLAFRCPRWEELPDVELYVDQVVNYVEKHLSALDVEQEGKLITASMINNYVKMKLIPAPVKKKYGLRQLARLIVLCSLKRDFSISELYGMTELVLRRYENGTAYNRFCDEMELNIRHVFMKTELPPVGDVPEDSIIRAVMTAFANKLYAHCAIRDFSGGVMPGEAIVAKADK